jgi:WD40 repeat protein
MLMVLAAVVVAALVLAVLRIGYTLDRPVRALAVSAVGRTLAVANEDLRVKFWDVTTGEPAAEELAGDPSMAGSWVAAAFSPDRRRLIATSTFSSNGVLWDLDKRSEEEWSTGQAEAITRLAFSPDGTLVAAASEDRTVAIWNLRQQRLHVPLLKPSQGAIQAIAFSADGTRLATGGADRTVLLWDVATGRRAAELPKDHEDSVRALAFSRDGHWLASGGNDARVRLRDLRAGRSTGTAPPTEYPVEELVFSPDGTQLAAAVYVMKKLFLWRVTDDGLTGEPIEMPEQAAQFAFSPDGKLLAVGTDRGSVELWDMTTRRPTGKSLN